MSLPGAVREWSPARPASRPTAQWWGNPPHFAAPGIHPVSQQGAPHCPNRQATESFLHSPIERVNLWEPMISRVQWPTSPTRCRAQRSPSPKTRRTCPWCGDCERTPCTDQGLKPQKVASAGAPEQLPYSSPPTRIQEPRAPEPVERRPRKAEAANRSGVPGVHTFTFCMSPGCTCGAQHSQLTPAQAPVAGNGRTQTSQHPVSSEAGVATASNAPAGATSQAGTTSASSDGKANQVASASEVGKPATASSPEDPNWFQVSSSQGKLEARSSRTLS